MILIADSGSTNCDWVLLDNYGSIVFRTSTHGLNPDILTTQELHKRVANSEEIAHVKQDIDAVYFYGAGCGTEKNKKRLKRFFEKYFRYATCHVHADLMAACLSVTDEPGIVCVLGTGSNSCYFDGKQSTPTAPSLGYTLMDEGSGNYFGKELLREYFYKRMPDDLAKKFRTEYDLTAQTIRDHLYKQENPNAYLGEFTRFIFSFESIPEYLENLLKDGLKLFIDNWVKPIPQAENLPVHFVGSIAYYSKNIIAELLKEDYNLTLGKIERAPIEGLVEYFQDKIRNNHL